MVSELQPKIDFVPAEEQVVDKLETLKVLADPLRSRIRELMVKPTTVKEVAAKLDVPATKLYYHINLLEKNELIVVVDMKLVSGIVEKHYQISAYRIRLAKHLLATNPDSENEGFSLAMSSIFESAHSDLLRAAHDGAVEWNDDGERHKSLSVETGKMFLTEEQAAEFYAELKTLFERFGELSQEQCNLPSAKIYRTLYMLFPMKPDNGDE